MLDLLPVIYMLQICHTVDMKPILPVAFSVLSESKLNGTVPLRYAVVPGMQLFETGRSHMVVLTRPQPPPTAVVSSDPNANPATEPPATSCGAEAPGAAGTPSQAPGAEREHAGGAPAAGQGSEEGSEPSASTVSFVSDAAAAGGSAAGSRSALGRPSQGAGEGQGASSAGDVAITIGPANGPDTGNVPSARQTPPQPVCAPHSCFDYSLGLY